jgi:DNA-binding XRE family transcriptional regulator
MSQGGVLRTMRRELGQRLRGARVAAGYSQAQLARRAGYARSTVSTVEGGGQNAPRLFWERCDDILTTGTALTSGFDAIARHAAAIAPAVPAWPAGSAGRRPGPAGLAAAGGPLSLDGRLLDAATVAEVADACDRLGWRTEAGHGRVSLLCGTGVDALEVARPAGMIAARWWLHTGGQPDEIRGLPALPSPADALAVIAAGERWYFLVQAGACPWSPAPGSASSVRVAAGGSAAGGSAGGGLDGGAAPAGGLAPAGAMAPPGGVVPPGAVAPPGGLTPAGGVGAVGQAASGPVLRWHAEGSRVPVPPSRDERGGIAGWAHLPPARFRPADPVVLLALLSLAARVAGQDALTLPGGVRVLPAASPAVGLAR